MTVARPRGLRSCARSDHGTPRRSRTTVNPLGHSVTPSLRYSVTFFPSCLFSGASDQPESAVRASTGRLTSALSFRSIWHCRLAALAGSGTLFRLPAFAGTTHPPSLHPSVPRHTSSLRHFVTPSLSFLRVSYRPLRQRIQSPWGTSSSWPRSRSSFSHTGPIHRAAMSSATSPSMPAAGLPRLSSRLAPTE